MDELTSEQDAQLEEWLVPGRKLRISYQNDNPNNKAIEIRGIVDGLIIYRTWFKRRQRWHYVVEDRYMFELWLRDGHLSKR